MNVDRLLRLSHFVTKSTNWSQFETSWHNFSEKNVTNHFLSQLVTISTVCHI